MSSTCQKAKSCPQPAEKQKWYHNPQKTKSSISYREQKKGSLQPRRMMTPDRGNPLKQGFSSLPLCTSCQQYYRLKVSDLNLLAPFIGSFPSRHTSPIDYPRALEPVSLRSLSFFSTHTLFSHIACDMPFQLDPIVSPNPPSLSETNNL